MIVQPQASFETIPLITEHVRLDKHLPVKPAEIKRQDQDDHEEEDSGNDRERMTLHEICSYEQDQNKHDYEYDEPRVKTLECRVSVVQYALCDRTRILIRKWCFDSVEHPERHEEPEEH